VGAHGVSIPVMERVGSGGLEGFGPSMLKIIS
jgi:hypothetical protein